MRESLLPGRTNAAASPGTRLLGSRAVTANVLIKAGGAALAFGSQIALARWLGPQAFGELVLFITACALLSIVARWGMDVSLVRRVALAHSRTDRDAVRALVVESTLFSLLGTAAVCAAFLAYGRVGSMPGALASVAPWMLVASVAAMTLVAVVGAAARGQSQVLQVEFVESVFRPVVWVVLVFIGAWLGLGQGAALGMMSYVLALAAAAFALGIHACPRGPMHWLQSIRMRSLGLPPPGGLALVGTGLIGFAMYQLDTLILGIHRPASELAGYNMACNFVRLVIFLPLILAAQAQPILAVSWAQSDRSAFFRTADSLLRRGVPMAALAAVVLLASGHWLLTLTHPAFAEATNALRILAVAHVFNAAALLVSAGLYMAGMERRVLWSNACGALCASVLYMELIPRYGSVGAALAAAAGMLIVFAMLVGAYVRHRSAVAT